MSLPYEGDTVVITKGGDKGKKGIVVSYETPCIGDTWYNIRLAPNHVTHISGKHIKLYEAPSVQVKEEEAPPCCDLTTSHEHCSKCFLVYYIGQYPLCPHDAIHEGRNALSSAPIVYYTDKSGTKYFAADPPHSKCIKHEVHYAQKSTFYKELSADNQRKFNQSQERQFSGFDAGESKRREDLLSRLQTPIMREKMMEKFKEHDRQRDESRRHNSDVYVEAFEYDRSNRMESRRDDGKRHYD